jgi:hypothetical protein
MPPARAMAVLLLPTPVGPRMRMRRLMSGPNSDQKKHGQERDQNEEGQELPFF